MHCQIKRRSVKDILQQRFNANYRHQSFHQSQVSTFAGNVQAIPTDLLNSKYIRLKHLQHQALLQWTDSLSLITQVPLNHFSLCRERSIPVRGSVCGTR